MAIVLGMITQTHSSHWNLTRTHNIVALWCFLFAHITALSYLTLVVISFLHFHSLRHLYLVCNPFRS